MIDGVRGQSVTSSAGSRTPRLSGARVLIVLPTLGRGGAERQAMLLGRYLAGREGADVRLVSVAHRDVSTALTPELDAAGLHYEQFTLGAHTFQKLVQVWDVARFTAMLRRYRPDILMPYTMLANVLCGITWRAGGAGLCIWNQRDEGRMRVAAWLERWAVRQTPFFLSNSAHGAQFVIDVLGVARARVGIIHNGIGLPAAERAPDSWRADLSVPRGALVATMVANLHRFKDHETLISAWRLVHDRLSGAPVSPPLLVLAGAPGDRADVIRKQIDELGLTGHVRLPGPVVDVRGLLGASDMLVFSSHREGLPNAVLEGMAAGLPVVATDYPGIREALGAGSEPWLARPSDAVDLAGRLVEVILDPELRQRLGALNRSRVEADFSVEAMGSATVDVICRLWRDRVPRS